MSWYDPKRGKARVKQAGRGGIGTVLRDKKIKAIVVRYTGMRADSNDPADLKRIRTVGQRINKEIVELDDEQNKMRRVGTAHLVEIMDDYDLLPTHNFKFGAHPDSPKINSLVWDALFTQNAPRFLYLRLHHGVLEGGGRLRSAHRALCRADASPWTGRSTRRWRAAARTSASSIRPTSSS